MSKEKKENLNPEIEVVNEDVQSQELDVFQGETDMIVLAEQRAGRFKKILNLALSVTTYRDWVNQNGNPYLVHSGAERISKLFGLSVTNMKRQKRWESDENGDKYYLYEYTGQVIARDGMTQDCLGMCSSKDAFFGKKNKEYLPISMIDETNIQKAAYTNCIVNGITHFLGLRNVTWDQLESAGIIRDKIIKVEYKDKKKDKTLIEDQLLRREEIIHFAKEMFGKDKEAIHGYIKTQTAFGDYKGNENVMELTGKQIDILNGKIKKDYEKWEKDSGQNEEIPEMDVSEE